MLFNCRNRTGRALTLFDGSKKVIVLSNGQMGHNIQTKITNVKLGGSSTVYSRKSGSFVNGSSYIATFTTDVVFDSDGQKVVFG